MGSDRDDPATRLWKWSNMAWTGVKWIIDMDIKGFFDNVNHLVMMQLLERRIDDHKFLRLVRGMLRAGYMEDWQFHATYSGTPQGGIISRCCPTSISMS